MSLLGSISGGWAVTNALLFFDIFLFQIHFFHFFCALDYKTNSLSQIDLLLKDLKDAGYLRTIRNVQSVFDIVTF